MKTVIANGARIPALGFGTWELRGKQCQELVEAAIGLGYRHVDTAHLYKNEQEVGAAIKASAVARDEIFLTTKIWPDHFEPEQFSRSLEMRLKLLDAGPVDLLLLHWPSQTVPLAPTLGALAAAKKQGFARHIGVSNFTVDLLNQAVALCDEPLVCNQIEFHPLINQDKVRAACAAHGIAVTAYCPIARNEVANEPVMIEIAQRHNISPAQLALAWLLGLESVVAIPRSSNVERIQANLDAAQVSLTDGEMASIEALKKKHMRLVDPAGISPVWDTV